MMIELIKIKNYALIQDSEIDLTKGLNIISGETGAGKSLFLGALSLIMGEKVSKNIIGKNGAEATVEVIIKQKDLTKKAIDLGIEVEKDGSLLIKRVFGEKNKCYINGELITQAQLKNLMKGSIDICSQHENQSILDQNNQLAMLDTYSSIDLDKLSLLYKELKSLMNEKVSLVKEKKQRDEKVDYFEYVLGEINKVNPTEEDIQIESRLSELKNKQKIIQVEGSIHQFFNEDEGIRSKLKGIYYELKELDEIKNQTKSEEFKELMNQILAFDVKSKDDSDEDIQYYLDRMENLSSLTKKHGGTIVSLLAEKEKLEQELDNIKNFDSNLSKIDGSIKKAEFAFLKEAELVSRKRKDHCAKLSKEIESNLKDLNMNNVKFSIEINKKDYSANGIDDIEYQISPNKGEALKPISEVASGGELSRVLLSIYNVLGGSNSVYLFDEVDAGIGGETGMKVGKKLKQMANNSQIICITHLPQVAVFAESNFKIDKKENSQKTVSNITKLDSKETEIEISRMLGAALNSSTALEHAKEMIKKAKI
jgi:DNA repair protein RecN (Recombination protein N)